MKIGVLSLQGAFREHVNMLRTLDVEAILVREKEDFDGLSGLILPGGESTTMGKLLDELNLKSTVVDHIEAGLPVWGTCAGLVLLAKTIDGENSHLGLMNIRAVRNAYGRQLGSFKVDFKIPNVTEELFPLVFIRAPIIIEYGDTVEVLCKIEDRIVAAREKNMLVTSFHPELTTDHSLHKYFIETFCQEHG